MSSESTNAYPAAAISDAMAKDNITEYCKELNNSTERYTLHKC